MCICMSTQYIVLGSDDHSILFVNICDKKLAFSLKTPSYSVCGLGMTQDEKYLVSCSYANAILIWNIQSKSLDRELYCHTDSLSGLCVADGNVFCCSSDGKALCINLESRALLVEIEPGIVSKDENDFFLAYGGCNGAVHVFRKAFNNFLLPYYHNKAVVKIATTQNSVISGCKDQVIVYESTHDQLIYIESIEILQENALTIIELQYFKEFFNLNY